MHARADQTCHSEMSKQPEIGNGVTECEWRHAPEACGWFCEILKKSVRVLRLETERDGWLSLARGGLRQVSHKIVGGIWKSQNRKIVPLSPYVEKPLNSKVIKSFVPKLRSRKCFSCFEIPMICVICIWTLYVYFTHGRIWLWYSSSSSGLDIP